MAGKESGRLRMMYTVVASWILRRPGVVLSAFGLATLAAILLLSRFRIDSDMASLFPRDDPTLRLTRHLQGDSPPGRVLFVILRSDDVGSLEGMLPAVVEQLRASPYLASVTATRLEFAGPRYEWIRRSPLHALPEETLDRLKARMTGPERRAELESTLRRLAEDPLAGKTTARVDPLGLRWIFDEASEHISDRFPAKLRPGSPYLLVEQPPIAFLRALGREDSSNTKFSRPLLADVRTRLTGVTGGTVRAELAGGYVSAETQEAALRRDIIVETIVSTVAVLAYVGWFTRSLLAAPLVFIPVILATVGSLAAGGALLGPLTPIVTSAAAILIAQGIDFPIHFFTRFRAERATHDRAGALLSAQLTMARPFSGIATTTLAAFLALLASRFPGFRQLGFVLSTGLALCLVATLVLFPVLLMPVDRFVRPAGVRTPWVVRMAAWIFRSRRRRFLGWVIAGLGFVSWGAVAWKGVRMDLDVRNAIAPGDPGQAALERLEKDLGTALTPVIALVDAQAEDDAVRAGMAALRRSGTVAASDGIHQLLPSAQTRARVERFQRETDGWVEGTLKDLAALGFRPEPFRKGLAETHALLTAPAPAEMDLDRPDFVSLRRSLIYEEDGRKYRVLYLFPSCSLWREEERAGFDRAVREHLGEGVRLFSAFHLPDHYSKVLDSDLRRIVGLTTAGVVLLTLLSIGSLRDGLCALVPVFLSTGITMGAIVILGGKINVINMAAIPIILAVGVDGGIHFMCRFREGGRGDPGETIREVGPGVWGSAATTLLGFGSIATSVTPGMASMGLLVVVGTLTSVLATLFLLPGLLQGRFAQAGRGGGALSSR